MAIEIEAGALLSESLHGFTEILSWTLTLLVMIIVQVLLLLWAETPPHGGLTTRWSLHLVQSKRRHHLLSIFDVGVSFRSHSKPHCRLLLAGELRTDIQVLSHLYRLLQLHGLELWLAWEARGQNW